VSVIGRQVVADKIFGALRAEGSWPVVYIDDMQKVLDRYAPANDRGAIRR
jgi:hypothetical protein